MASRKSRVMFTKIVSYRCCGEGVISGTEEVMFQMKLLHHYRNALVQNELSRRKSLEQERDMVYPRLKELREEIKALDDRRMAVRKEMKEDSSRERKKVRDPELVLCVNELSSQIKALSNDEKTLRQAANADHRVIEAWQTVEQQHNISKKGNGLRHQYSSQGLSSGNYQQAETQVKRTGRPPRFRRWTGEGKVRVYLGQKGDDGKGVKATQIISGNCREVIIAERTFTNKEGTEYKRHVCTLRLMPEVFCEIMFDYDRPLEGEIRDVSLVRRKVATHWKWYLQFVCTKPVSWEKKWKKGKQATEGRVAINTGHRKVKGGLRVAYWYAGVGDDRKPVHGHIVIPDSIISRVRKVEEIQSIRADNYRTELQAMRRWLPDANVPEWMLDRTRHIAHWGSQSQARLASLVLFWRDNRFVGDEAMFVRVEEWRHQDRHLYDWQEHQRKSNDRWRECFYREELQKLAMKYKTVVIACKVPEHKSPEPEEEDSGVVIHYRNLAANGRFHQLAQETFAECVRTDPGCITMRCQNCDQVSDVDREMIEVTCPGCHVAIDQDYRAAINLARAEVEGRTTDHARNTQDEEQQSVA